MSDLLIHEFRDRAERGLDVPDVAEIQRRGRSLRRRRAATAVGSLALVLAAAGGVSTLATDGGDNGSMPATPPDPSRSPAWDSGIRTTYDRGEEVLQPGESQVRYGPAMVRFTAPSKNWEWWDVGFGLRRTATSQDDYAAAVFFMPQPTVRLAPCDASRSTPLGTDPDRLVDNVSPLLEMAHSRVLQQPREVTAFGTRAVYLRLETTAGCEQYGGDPSQLRGLFNGGNVEPGFGGRHELELWHVVVPGETPQSLLVAAFPWDQGGGERHQPEIAAMIDSIEIEPVD